MIRPLIKLQFRKYQDVINVNLKSSKSWKYNNLLSFCIIIFILLSSRIIELNEVIWNRISDNEGWANSLLYFFFHYFNKIDITLIEMLNIFPLGMLGTPYMILTVNAGLDDNDRYISMLHSN